MENTATPMRNFEVSSNGDLYLDVENGTACILVSSQIMAFFSPVFNKMLNSEFKESLHHNQGTEKHQISLPEDKAQPMVTLAKIFHHCTESVDLTFKGPGFTEDSSWRVLAQLCDKYDCVDVVRPMLTLWFPYERLPDNDSKLADLLLAALVMNMYDLFSIVSFKIIFIYWGYMTEFQEVIDEVKGVFHVPPALIGKYT